MVIYEILWPIEVQEGSESEKYNDLPAHLMDCIRQLHEMAQNGQEVPLEMTMEELQLFAADGDYPVGTDNAAHVAAQAV